MLFGEASVDNATVIKETLNIFCRYFGHKINAAKSKLFFSHNIDDILTGVVGNIIGFQLMDDLGIYLGVPLFHSRVNKNTY